MNLFKSLVYAPAIATIATLTLMGPGMRPDRTLAHPAKAPASGMPTGPMNASHHGTLEIPAGQPLPTVKLIVHPDAKQGWNLEVQVSNFRFAPERVNTQSLPTEGHAHLYIDGKKVTRLYGSWYYLEKLPPGQHQIKVGLNANGHEALFFQRKPIEATVIIKVP